MNWVLIFLGFSALIVLHEAGHFFAAKTFQGPLQSVGMLRSEPGEQAARQQSDDQKRCDDPRD